ncbi:MAG TPA: hypothetical protein VHY91_20390 [Pirellulales bacterium]|jgi:hypothetical protein|nr:hypothetical protein [Pirellulales bacterium]
MSTESVCLYPCADGPLRGELHDWGPQFFFDGRVAALESGFYRLENGEYRWQPEPSRRSSDKR